MYALPIIEANIARFVDSERVRTNNPKFQLVRFDPAVIDEMVEHLAGITDAKSGDFLRPLTKAERAFVENELVMCQLDWRYWNENYAYIELASASDRPEGWDLLLDDADRASEHHPGTRAGGPLGKFILNGMQLALLKKLAELEGLAYDQSARGVPVNGILLIILKARQLGASTAWQSLIRHRVNFYGNFPALVSSIDSQSTQALQRRSDRIYEHMPPWMRTRIRRSTIDGVTVFENGSLIELQDFKQQKDLGKGETWRGWHGTELSIVAQERAEDHFDEGLFPAIPYDRRVLAGAESTAKGKQGWWYDFCTQVMSGTAEGGAGRFDWFFAPLYLIDAFESARGQRSKYRMEPPLDWVPSANTQLVAERVYETSPEYMPDHSRVRLDREVLYWYELTRQQYFRKGKLNIFKQNYPIEPIDAFQHSAAGAFTTESIDRMQLNCARYSPIPYRLMTDDELPLVEQYLPLEYESRDLAPIHHVGGYHIGPMHSSELDRDSRGIIWLWEQPDTRHAYYQSADPSGGVPKWSRAFRSHNDINVDNATNQIWRKQKSAHACEQCRGLGWLPTPMKGVQLECVACDGRGRVGGRGVQVAEFSAPIDPEEHALYIYLLGRIFRGDSDMDECPALIERNNTGILTIRTLQNKYSYTNLAQTQSLMEGTTQKLLNSIGFNSHPSTVPALHARGRLVLVRRDMEPRSKWLVKELSDAVIKVSEDSGRERFHVPSGGGRHDDRMTTAFLAAWMMFDGSGDDFTENAAESAARDLPPARNLAASDASAADQHRIWNEAAEVLFGEYDLHFGHFPDCALDCASKHTPDDEDLEDWENDPYADEDDADASGGGSW